MEKVSMRDIILACLFSLTASCRTLHMRREREEEEEKN